MCVNRFKLVISDENGHTAFDGKSNSFLGSGERDGVMVMMVE